MGVITLHLVRISKEAAEEEQVIFSELPSKRRL